MGKDARARVLADHQAKAIGRMIRVSPRKLNLVAQTIRGKKAEAALNELTFSPKRVAKVVKKILQSAIANAENNHDLDVDDLVVSEASVGKNIVMKRFHARARGRGAGIEKPFSQITIVVEERREKKAPAKAEPVVAAEEKKAGKPKKKAPKKRAPAKKPAAKKPAAKKSAPKRAKENA
jgi:large subunit ribosomal protein L22